MRGLTVYTLQEFALMPVGHVGPIGHFEAEIQWEGDRAFHEATHVCLPGKTQGAGEELPEPLADMILDYAFDHLDASFEFAEAERDRADRELAMREDAADRARDMMIEL